MKLVLRYQWGDIACSGSTFIPFEYESKEKFVFDVLEKYKGKDWQIYGSGDFVSYEEVEVISDVFLTRYDIESIEHRVYTLEEWFNERQIEIELL